MPKRSDLRYADYRFPTEVMPTAVWLSFPCPLSLWMVEGMLVARGSVVNHQPVRVESDVRVRAR
ncbi:hypothetical protein [Azospirillum sp. BE72]|uniref:hypothetical protein n=1 Tax=Azospirillum sp. BE72 TaxID=2817776 RepID=UPI00285D41AE|nr:hypothetical protein [Azospirillum sp. BE72]MDR6772696.1 putative transposase [Azospirillum sp. BE72]